MKFRNYSFVLILVFFFVFLASFCLSNEKAGQEPTRELLDILVLDKDMEIEDHLEKIGSLQKAIRELYGDLGAKFRGHRPNDFEAMAVLLERKSAIIQTPAYTRIQGKNDITKFWRANWKKGASLELATKSVFMTDKVEIEEVYIESEGEKFTIDCVAFVNCEIHVIITSPGEPVHNDTFSVLLVMKHRYPCPWDG